MKKLINLFWRVYIFFDLWGSPDPWSPVPAKIGASFAWELAKPLADFSDEMSHWDRVEDAEWLK